MNYTIAQIALVVIASTLIISIEILHDKGKIHNSVRYVLTALIFMSVVALSVLLPLHKYGIM